MKQKRFSLQAVLDLRVKAREQAEDALAKAIRERDIAAARCAEAIARLEELTRMITGERFAAYVREQGWNAINAQRDLLRTLEARLLQAEKKVSASARFLSLPTVTRNSSRNSRKSGRPPKIWSSLAMRKNNWKIL